ncbi:MAG: ferritin family protein [Desulfuromonas sp.]|nr:ferritin family protein [Desulfuromonas sp.]
MDKISRREFICLSAAMSLLYPINNYAITQDNFNPITQYPVTISGLKKAFSAEMVAHKFYLCCVDKALAEGYCNIAYMFYSFALSEKNHANNYQHLLNRWGKETQVPQGQPSVRDTKTNLKKATKNELEKIKRFYPELLTEIATEACEEAIINCMYAWKSHRQHEAKVQEIQKYSRFFFSSVVKKIEGLDLDFHICEICGSTIDKAPQFPCEICNQSILHYKKVAMPG